MGSEPPQCLAQESGNSRLQEAEGAQGFHAKFSPASFNLLSDKLTLQRVQEAVHA